MTIKPQMRASVNPARPEINEKLKTGAQLRALASALNNGAHERCPSCLKWIAKKQVGTIAIYIPYDDRPRVPYVLCRRCTSNITGTAEQQAALTKRVESYLDGGAK